MQCYKPADAETVLIITSLNMGEFLSAMTLAFLYSQSAFPYSFNFDRISSEGTSSVAPACTLSGFTTAKPIIPVMTAG
jgi:hypothetical protein